MKNIFRKAAALFLAVTFLHVPAVAEEERKALYIAPFVSSEQLSYTCKNLIDDFEGASSEWSVDGGEFTLVGGGACGEGCMSVSYGESVSLSTVLDEINASSAGGACAVFKSNTEDDVEITLSVASDGDSYEASSVIPAGAWYSVSLDIRSFKGADSLDSLKISASGGGFSLDYVHISHVYAPVGAVEGMTDEYTFSGRSFEVTKECIKLTFDKKDAQLESGRVDRLLADSENALSITLDNRADASKLTVSYSDEFGTYKKRNSYTCDISTGVGTYLIPLDGIDRLSGYRLSFSSKPNGEVEIYDISLTSFKSPDTSGKCYTDGENITVTFDARVQEGASVLLYRTLFANDEVGEVYLTEPTEENTFVFPVRDGDKNNLLYKYTVVCEQDGQTLTLCRGLTVANAEECALASAFIEPMSKKGVIGEFYPSVGTVFLDVSPYAFISDDETKYSYTVGGKTFYIHTDSAEYLDRRVAGISAVGGAVYVCIPMPSSLGELKNEEFVYKYSAAVGYIASRYSKGELGTVNGFVVGAGTVNSDSLEIVKAALDIVYCSAKSENGKCDIVLPLDAAYGERLYGTASSAFAMCPYISDVMVFCGDDVQGCLDEKGFDLSKLISSLEARCAREVGLFVSADDYAEPYGGLVRDFYSLYEKSFFKCLAVKHAEAVKSGNAFRYMDTLHGDRYVGELCGEFGFASWDELCDTSVFSETVRKNATGYISYGTVISVKDRIFTNTEGGRWLCGVGCTSLSEDEKYIMASLDNSAGYGYVVLVPDEPVTVHKRTVSVKLKVDYLGADEKTADVFVTLMGADKTVSCAVSVQAGADTVISFECDGVRRAEKIVIGINGTGTPRLCVSEGFVSSDGGAETEGEKNSDEVTENISDSVNGDGGNTVFLVTAVAVIFGIFALVGGILWFLDRKRAKKR